MIYLDNPAEVAERIAERFEQQAEKARVLERSCIADAKRGLRPANLDGVWQQRHAAENRAAIYRDIAADLRGLEKPTCQS